MGTCTTCSQCGGDNGEGNEVLTVDNKVRGTTLIYGRQRKSYLLFRPQIQIFLSKTLSRYLTILFYL